jgi:hypothetical protein
MLAKRRFSDGTWTGFKRSAYLLLGEEVAAPYRCNEKNAFLEPLAQAPTLHCKPNAEPVSAQGVSRFQENQNVFRRWSWNTKSICR